MPAANYCLTKRYNLQCTNELQLDATVFALVVSSFEFVNCSDWLSVFALRHWRSWRAAPGAN